MYDKNVSLTDLWNKVLLNMKKENDINAYNTFFLPLVPKKIKNDKLIIEAPTRFVKEIVSSDRFTLKLNNCLKSLVDFPLTVDIKEKNEITNASTHTNSIKLEPQLNNNYTFNNFVVGPCNCECYQASLATAKDPGQYFNPLFIYGRAGIGKTHLLHAIGNYCKESSNANLNIYYTTANDFIDEFMRSSQNKDIDSMKLKFKSIDILLLDDVQFLAGKDKTCEVFFQIFNNLINEKKQIVLTSDRNPNDLRGLEVRLVSRFSSGLTVGMNAPEYETAKEILKKKIEIKNTNLKTIDDEVLDFIAENYSSDVRQLEGALNRLFFYVTTINKTEHINKNLAIEALKNITPPKKSNTALTASAIKKTVCDYYNISEEQLISTSRVSSITTPRFIAIYLCRVLLTMTFEEIGLEFGNRDHTTIMNACVKIEKAINEDNAYKLVINKIKEQLTN
ncbi:MAG: chromosomal replication initiator protein DnaA [Candidatus Caccosoma sp.]|nr:chromosomal replication initiator protein DnaA [Candidatus Caccosoma sp.]